MTRINKIYPNPYFNILLFAVIETVNIVFMDSPLNLIVTIPEILYVIFLMCAGKIEIALMYHLIFVALSFESFTALTDSLLFSYGKLKLVGPFGVSYIVTFLLFLLSFDKSSKEKTILLHKVYDSIKLLALLGVILGFVGFALRDYSFRYFLPPFVYVTVGLITVKTVLNRFTLDFAKQCYYYVLYLMIASSIVSFLTFQIFHVSTLYSVSDVFYYNEMYIYIPCLIIAFFQHDEIVLKNFIILALSLFFINIIAAGRGGMIMSVFIVIILLVYIIYFKKSTLRNQKVLKIIFPVLAIGFVMVGVTLLLSGSQLTSYKLGEISSMMALFDFDKPLLLRIQGIAHSPYIRVAETLNLLSEWKNNVIDFIIGKGFGGYFQDNLGLFQIVDLSNGAFSDDQIKSGKFYSAHSVYPNAILYNGIWGLLILIKLGFSYLRNIDKSYLCFCGFVLFLQYFYYDPIMLIDSIFIMMAAESKLQQNKVL